MIRRSRLSGKIHGIRAILSRVSLWKDQRIPSRGQRRFAIKPVFGSSENLGRAGQRESLGRALKHPAGASTAGRGTTDVRWGVSNPRVKRSVCAAACFRPKAKLSRHQLQA
jgi:hypothetical protein